MTSHPVLVLFALFEETTWLAVFSRMWKQQEVGLCWVYWPPSAWWLQLWLPRSAAGEGSSRPHQSLHCTECKHIRWTGMSDAVAPWPVSLKKLWFTTAQNRAGRGEAGRRGARRDRANIRKADLHGAILSHATSLLTTLTTRKKF